MQEFLDNRGRRAFSAVYVTSEMMTFGAMKAIRQYGLRIPEDISIVGFDFHDKAGLVYPSITTIREPEVLIGTKVGELLLERLGKAGEDMSRLETDNKVLLEPELQIGQSVRCIL